MRLMFWNFASSAFLDLGVDRRYVRRGRSVGRMSGPGVSFWWLLGEEGRKEGW